MKFIFLSEERRTRVFTVGISAAFLLYLLVVLIAEPLRTFANTTAATWVSFEVLGTDSLVCDNAATIPPAIAGVTASSGNTVLSVCTVRTNNSAGYSLTWIISTSTGTLTPPCTQASRTVDGCYGTGHLMNTNVTNGKPDLILAMKPSVTGANGYKYPYRLDNITNVSASGARWGARLSSISTTTGGGDVTWGSDSATEGYVPVATGSAINIAKRNSPTSADGDLEYIRWKAIVPSGVFVPTGTYKTYVQFTETAN
jgi:hypothetical protein